MSSAKAVKGPTRWWKNVERTQTVEAEPEPMPRRPSLDERVDTMRRINNQIVHHQCEIAKLEQALEAQQTGMLVSLKELDQELQFGRRLKDDPELLK